MQEDNLWKTWLQLKIGGDKDMEVHFQFNGKEYADSIVRDYLTSKNFKKNLIIQFIVYVALVLLLAVRIRYRSIRYAFYLAGFIGLFFIKKLNVKDFRNDILKSYSLKNDDVRVVHIKLEENFLTIGEINEERKYSYSAIKEAYVIGEYLYIRFVKDNLAFVHSRAFRDAESTKAFVNELESKTNLKVYRKANEKVI